MRFKTNRVHLGDACSLIRRVCSPRMCATAEVIGVAYLDFFHYQTAVAPTEIELHPILKDRCIAY